MLRRVFGFAWHDGPDELGYIAWLLTATEKAERPAQSFGGRELEKQALELRIGSVQIRNSWLALPGSAGLLLGSSGGFGLWPASGEMPWKAPISKTTTY